MKPRTFVVGCVLPQPAAVGQASPDDLPTKQEAAYQWPSPHTRCDV
jgi:hypothetical protein